MDIARAILKPASRFVISPSRISRASCAACLYRTYFYIFYYFKAGSRRKNEKADEEGTRTRYGKADAEGTLASAVAKGRPPAVAKVRRFYAPLSAHFYNIFY